MCAIVNQAVSDLQIGYEERRRRAESYCLLLQLPERGARVRLVGHRDHPELRSVHHSLSFIDHTSSQRLRFVLLEKINYNTDATERN